MPTEEETSLTELQAELVEIKAAISRIRTQGQSGSMKDVASTRASLDSLMRDRTRCEKSIQRLRAGGRGISIDLASPANGSDESAAIYQDVP